MEPTKQEKQRTKRQNKAMHKWFNLVSEALMRDGYTVEQVFSGEIELMPTPEVMKEVWRQVMYKQTGKTSTKDMNTKDLDMIYDVLNKKMGEKAGVHVAWPSEEEMSLMNMEVPYGQETKTT